MNRTQSLWKLVSIFFAIAAGGCGSAVIGGVVDEDAGASSTTSTTHGGGGSSGTGSTGAGGTAPVDECWSCACINKSGDMPAGCADTCDQNISGAQNPSFCNGVPAQPQCAACLKDRCGIPIPTECKPPPTCWSCACNNTSGTVPAGCADTCDANVAGQSTPNFCNGAPPHSACDLCIADRCGVTDLSLCQAP